MTVSQLHALYCAAHAEARRLSDGGVAGERELEVDGAGLSVLERVVLEFALHDVTNGTPMRSLLGFQHAVAQGADLLGALGLQAGPAHPAEQRGSPAALPHQLAQRLLVRRAAPPLLGAR